MTDWIINHLAEIGFAAVCAAFALQAAYYRRVARREYSDGLQVGYLRGRRDERDEAGRKDSLAYYPLITETMSDGTTRRLDR